MQKITFSSFHLAKALDSRRNRAFTRTGISPQMDVIFWREKKEKFILQLRRRNVLCHLAETAKRKK